MNVVHLDVISCYRMNAQENKTFYFSSEEEKCLRKPNCTKTTFLTAIARPRYDHFNYRAWDGKIGIWSFLFIDKHAICELIRKGVIPAIEDNMPRYKTHRITLQYDPALQCALEDDNFVLEEADWALVPTTQQPRSQYSHRLAVFQVLFDVAATQCTGIF